MIAPRERVILAALLISANQVVPVARLADAIWGSTPPQTSRGQVQIGVSTLRRLFASAGIPSRILTSAPGYSIRIAKDDLDLNHFDQLVAEGRRALTRDRPGEATELFRAALSLWRGAPLGNVVSAAVESSAAQLSERRLTVLEQTIELELELGRAQDLIGELMGLVAEHPLRERFHRQLMTALLYTGRRADVLAAYRNARRTFIQELGLEPGDGLQKLLHAALTDAAVEPSMTP